MRVKNVFFFFYDGVGFFVCSLPPPIYGKESCFFTFYAEERFFYSEFTANQTLNPSGPPINKYFPLGLSRFSL